MARARDFRSKGSSVLRLWGRDATCSPIPVSWGSRGFSAFPRLNKSRCPVNLTLSLRFAPGTATESPKCREVGVKGEERHSAGSYGPGIRRARCRQQPTPFVSESPPDKAALPAQAPEPPQLRERQEYRHSRAVHSLSGISKAFCSAQISPLASLSPQTGTGSPTFISSAMCHPGAEKFSRCFADPAEHRKQHRGFCMALTQRYPLQAHKGDSQPTVCHKMVL